MKAVVFVPGPGRAGVEVREIPQPLPAAGEVLVRVRAAGLNRGELAVRAGLTAGAPQQSGIEFAGEIAALGAGAARFKAGDRVMGHWKGGQAEYVTVDERLLVPVPGKLSWIQAGAWLNVFCTAHDAIVTNAGLQAGESILINAVSSGIGVAALQIARLLGANPVLGSSRVAAKLEKLAPYGMTRGILADAGMTKAVLDATGGKGVDVLIDNVGGTVLPESLKMLALKGRLVSVGRLGANVGPIDLDYLALRRLRLIGVTFRTRTLEERIQCVQRCAADLLQPLAEGKVFPVVQRTFPMVEIAAAHDCMERDEHIGKLVLEIA